MNGNGNNNYNYSRAGELPNPGDFIANQGARPPILRNDIALPIPAQEMANALLQYGSSILPYWSSMNFNYTAANAAVEQSINVDASYYLFIYGASFYLHTGATDYVTSITTLQIDTLTNFVQGPMPVVMFTQFNAAPPPFFLVVPAKSQLTIEITNGATAVNYVRMTTWGQRVPARLANSILDKFGMQPLG